MVIAQSTTGSIRDAGVNRALKALLTVDCNVVTARAAATHRYRAGATDTIDAIVVATADSKPGCCIVTGDVDKITRLAASNGRTRVVAINSLS